MHVGCASQPNCLIVGPRQALLPAEIYLARFRHGAELVEVGESRATLIPRTHNHAGYPGSIPGKELLALMRRQAWQFGATARSGLLENARTR
ncbi:hypothetical protein ACM61V_17315 [Sphingomonas sp. TX0543]|uniref:hypothetical protein n=1 Tax=Sphingomonadales TaxID=204457 RepID=UPI001C0E335B|nr:hypothetical protein [Sphingobium xenophagum]QWT14422.1 hypothetical protein GTV57_01130 [Sphingobium xenophagum]